MRDRNGSIERGLVTLSRAKLRLVSASERARREVRDCATCDARCCRVGFNSMLVTRIEAVALARRLEEPDLVDRIPEILERARREVEVRGLIEDPDANYDCPLLDEEGRCRVHGPAQPAGCLTFRPVADGGCDHDLARFGREAPALRSADRKAFGRESEPIPIPLALLRVMAKSGGRGVCRRGSSR